MAMIGKPGAAAFMTTLIAISLATGSPTPALANDGDTPWKVHGKLLGKKDATGSDSKKSEDVSGIACATTTGFPRICLLVDDETQGAQIVVLKDGELIAGDFIRLIEDAHDGKPVELDAEGVAYADGTFYVIGSHGRPRHEADASDEAKNQAKAAASRHAYSIRIPTGAVDLETGKLTANPDIKGSTEVSRLIMAEAGLAPSFDKPLAENGVTIEGIAVRNGDLYLGLRAPVFGDGHAAILSIPLDMLFEGRTGQVSLHPVDLGKDTSGNARGVRDIVAYGPGFLLIAGPVLDPPDGEIKPGDYSIYSWNGTSVLAPRLLDLKRYGRAVKPEGLLPLDGRHGSLRALLLFDGPEEGAPTPVKIR